MASILPDGYRHIALGDVGSTNTECLQAAKKGEAGNLWITAKRQLAGRGSRGRQWVSEAGNLYASLLLDDMPVPALTAQLTFVASLAIRDAILAVAHRESVPDITLKWPNDVLVGGAKVSGILLESHEIDCRRIAIIGMGINLAHCPEMTRYPATSLAAARLQVTPERFLGQLASALALRLGQWARGAGFAAIRRAWLDSAAGIGEPVRVAISGNGPSDGEQHERSGIFTGIDDNGLMLLQTAAGGQEKIAAADIFFA